jgi:RNA-directed DNA polymerase
MAWRSVSRGAHRRTVLISEITSRERQPCTTVGKAIWTGAIARVLAQLPGARDLRHVRKRHVREPGELGSGWGWGSAASPAGEGRGHNPSMYTAEQSDRPIVPEKPSNKVPSTLSKGPRSGGDGGGKEASGQGEQVSDRQGLHTEAGVENLLSGLERVREAARRNSTERFTALLHHVTVDLLRQAYYKLNPKAAPGVDEVTWKEYGQGLEVRLVDLHGRVHSGRYRANPSKRIYLWKADGRQRAIGIAAMEDKIVQQAVGWVLEQIYEEEFVRFSYGFRPGRSAHQALDAIWVGMVQRKVNWIVDADVRGFFDHLDHGWMRKFLEHRIGDRRILRLIGKWLRAGVSEGGEWSRTAVGTAQGAVISPLLANIYLHYVLDLWVQQWRRRKARGEVIIVRYADDFVLGFQYGRRQSFS